MSTVSIVIPCYNHAQFLEETIASVLNSTYKQFEIIIVNDGSSDNSEALAQQLANENPNITYLYQQNQGPSVARNYGIKTAKGKYILPLDADDRISADYIEKAVAVLESAPKVKVVYCEAEFFGEKSGKWKLPEFSRKYLARENMIFLSAMFRKADWESIGGFDERMTWGWEDWEFWISMLKNDGDVVRLPITGFFYRIRKGSRRKSTNKIAKKKTIALINEKHSAFIYSQLHGPLRTQRSCSVFVNKLSNLLGFSKL
ncbi:MAG TPA: glycosyltransferase family A protein [Prolixibacteraceae bacterium]|nr:glycosyltransferase family A protein [Prolixibacteraceae bacterium]